MRFIPSRFSPAAFALCVAGLVLSAAGHAQAQKAAPSEKPAAAAAAAAKPTESQVQARAMLMQMAQYLGKAQRFSVVVSGAYDAVQENGQKIEFGENRKITLSRPDNRLRVEGEHSDGTKVLTVFDGKQITLIDSRSNVFATAPQTGKLDETIIHFVRDLGVRLPLAAMLLSRLPAEFEERLRSVDYIERTSIHGTPAHHLLASTESVDFQVWIADGDKPLPLRVVLTYREEKGEPQFRARLTGWSFAPAITEKTFSAAVPKGAQKVAFVGELARRAAAQQPKTDKK